MTNSSAPLFFDLEQQSIVDKQKAELYMQIYQYAAEDFFTVTDANTYSMLMVQYMTSLEMQLDRLMKVLAAHTHMLPPHSHQGVHGPTSPWIGATLTPITAPAIQWVPLYKPQVSYTTGTTPNMSGNFVAPGVASEGIISPGLRRAMPLPKTLEITLPPVLTGAK
jgi:hypothetical protein